MFRFGLKMAIVGLLLSPSLAQAQKSVTSGAGATITDGLINVGKCDGAFVPIKWSPDGSRIAFFRDGKIVLCDTLGAQRTLQARTFRVRVFDWIDNDELLIYDALALNRDSVVYELLRVQLHNETISSLDVYRRYLHGIVSGRADVGAPLPHRTTEGLLYYIKHVAGGDPQTVYPGNQATVDSRSSRALPSARQTVLRALTDGLYLVSLDQKDTTLVYSRPIKNSIINRFHTYIMAGGTIIRLRDGRQTVLDTMFTGLPDSTYGCGIGRISFAPSRDMVAFTRFCDDGHNYEVSQAGLYDISTDKLILLDDMTGSSNCRAPSVSATGHHVALRCGAFAYILMIK